MKRVPEFVARVTARTRTHTHTHTSNGESRQMAPITNMTQHTLYAPQRVFIRSPGGISFSPTVALHHGGSFGGLLTLRAALDDEHHWLPGADVAHGTGHFHPHVLAVTLLATILQQHGRAQALRSLAPLSRDGCLDDAAVVLVDVIHKRAAPHFGA